MLAMAFNRYSAVTYPFQYKLIFTGRSTLALVVASFGVAAAQTVGVEDTYGVHVQWIG